MTAATLEIVAPAGEPTIVTRRVIKAPPALLWDVWTKPEHMRRWLGPKRLEMVECEVDLRVGGSYRFVHRAPDGQEFGFHGVYREIDKPRRLVSTFVFEPWPDVEAVDTLTFEEVDGGTLVTTSSRHPSIEARDGHLAGGMEGGMTEGYERLDALVAMLQSA